MVNNIHAQWSKFHEGNNDKLIVFIHGFFGSPNQFKHLANQAYDKGYSVLCMLLPGHGKTGEEFSENGLPSWQAHVNSELSILSKKFKNIILTGHSMGGLLSLKASLNKKNKVRAIILISTPMSIKFTSRGIFNGIHVTFVSEKMDNEINKSYRCANSIVSTKLTTYPKWIRQVNDLKKLIKQTYKILPEITAPVLIFQSKNDETVDYKSANRLFDELSCKRRRVWLEKSWHSHFVQSEKDLIDTEIFDFLQSNKLEYE